MIPFSIIWLAEVVYHVFNLFYGGRVRLLAIARPVIDIVGIVVLFLMLGDANLYTNYATIVGSRAIVAIIFVISVIEMIGSIVRLIKYAK